MGLGIYCIIWCKDDMIETTNVDWGNTFIVLVNGLVNLWQSAISCYGKRELFKKWDTRTKTCESVLQVVIMIVCIYITPTEERT